MASSESKSSPNEDRFSSALSKIAKADAASSRAAIQASKATKPSLHTRFVYDPAKDRA
jgi:hypothetical protein